MPEAAVPRVILGEIECWTLVRARRVPHPLGVPRRTRRIRGFVSIWSQPGVQTHAVDESRGRVRGGLLIGRLPGHPRGRRAPQRLRRNLGHTARLESRTTALARAVASLAPLQGTAMPPAPRRPRKRERRARAHGLPVPTREGEGRRRRRVGEAVVRSGSVERGSSRRTRDMSDSPKHSRMLCRRRASLLSGRARSRRTLIATCAQCQGSGQFRTRLGKSLSEGGRRNGRTPSL